MDPQARPPDVKHLSSIIPITPSPALVISKRILDLVATHCATWKNLLRKCPIPLHWLYMFMIVYTYGHRHILLGNTHILQRNV